MKVNKDVKLYLLAKKLLFALYLKCCWVCG